MVNAMAKTVGLTFPKVNITKEKESDKGKELNKENSNKDKE